MVLETDGEDQLDRSCDRCNAVYCTGPPHRLAETVGFTGFYFSVECGARDGWRRSVGPII